MGEFAIGTNTTAYVAAGKYGIADKLPILIAEKMGPHFAVGDTCYSWSEDTSESITRTEKRSLPGIMRFRSSERGCAAWLIMDCHTDITIPYEELGSIRVVDEDGKELSIIENGRFVLPGTEELNEPLDQLKMHNNWSA